MWMSSEDARSDFVLAAAALVFGSMVTAFLTLLPFFPAGIIGDVIALGFIYALMIRFPRFLGRYREQGLEAHGLGADRSGITDGLLIAAPILVFGYVRLLSASGVAGAVLGRIGATNQSTIATLTVIDIARNLAILTVAAIGSVLLYGLLVTRARDAFRATEISLVEGLRSYGLGALGIGTLMGLLLSLVPGGVPTLHVLLDSAGLLVALLLVDRLVVSKDRTTRATILGPAIVVVASYVFAFGGLFGGGLQIGLYRGGMAACTAVLVAALIETRRAAWAAVPVIIATLWVPTCGAMPVAHLIATGGLGC
jgi:hypothetical protein